MTQTCRWPREPLIQPPARQRSAPARKPKAQAPASSADYAEARPAKTAALKPAAKPRPEQVYRRARPALAAKAACCSAPLRKPLAPANPAPAACPPGRNRRAHSQAGNHPALADAGTGKNGPALLQVKARAWQGLVTADDNRYVIRHWEASPFEESFGGRCSRHQLSNTSTQAVQISFAGNRSVGLCTTVLQRITSRQNQSSVRKYRDSARAGPRTGPPQRCRCPHAVRGRGADRPKVWPFIMLLPMMIPASRTRDAALTGAAPAEDDRKHR